MAAHSGEYIYLNGANQVDYFLADVITRVAGENAGSTAQVTWRFTPNP